jgi:hypothetical protein
VDDRDPRAGSRRMTDHARGCAADGTERRSA